MGLSRDWFYKRCKRAEARAQREAKVVMLACEQRDVQPRVGCRKLLEHIAGGLEELGITFGRDKFFELLGRHGMHVERKKKYVRTTYSNHGYAVAQNMIKGSDFCRPNQVFVADITYLRTWGAPLYLFLVTDLVSRKIVGYHLSANLTHFGAILALEMALKAVPKPAGIIHHSDRGCQYCCDEFLDFLSRQGMVASMTDEAHCYQNAVAERVNGILKDELLLDSVFPNAKIASAAVHSAIMVYNGIRLHGSLSLKTPAEVYAQAA